MTDGRPPARVSAILARAAPIAVVFRRGPSRWVLALKWNTDTDELEPGDWFRGRLYEHRCDVTPDGSHLVYFAATHGGGGLPRYPSGYSWTAVSRPPSLQPIAYWEQDHSWYGGGLFEDDRHLWVNRPTDDASLSVPGFAVTFNEEAQGEDEPIYGMRRTRDGWEVRQKPTIEMATNGYRTSAPEIREKPGPGSAALRWTRALNQYKWSETFELVDADGTSALDGAQWADWDQRGRLVLSRDGVLYAADREIADLNGFQPEVNPPTA